MLDTGATHHVCCSLPSFVSSVPASNSSVTLPNGHLVSISRIGSVQLSPHITLTDVLFVPQFQFNLLSVSALTQSHKYSVNFLSHSCLIQDHSQAKMIELGKRHGNLYVLDFSSLVSQSFDISATCNNFSSSPTKLWHYRLGHPSYAKIHTLKDDLNISHIFETPSYCSICHLAKQRRLPFMFSNNLSNSPFQLIHIDVWGPFHTITTEGYHYFFTIIDDCTRFTWVYFL